MSRKPAKTDISVNDFEKLQLESKTQQFSIIVTQCEDYLPLTAT
jgi:hypothetical protein